MDLVCAASLHGMVSLLCNKVRQRHVRITRRRDTETRCGTSPLVHRSLIFQQQLPATVSNPSMTSHENCEICGRGVGLDRVAASYSESRYSRLPSSIQSDQSRCDIRLADLP